MAVQYDREQQGYRGLFVGNQRTFEVPFGPVKPGTIEVTLSGNLQDYASTPIKVWGDRIPACEMRSTHLPPGEFKIELKNTSGQVVATGAPGLKYEYQPGPTRPQPPSDITGALSVGRRWTLRVTYVGQTYTNNAPPPTDPVVYECTDSVAFYGSIYFTCDRPMVTRTISLDLLNRKLDEQVNRPKPVEIKIGEFPVEYVQYIYKLGNAVVVSATQRFDLEEANYSRTINRSPTPKPGYGPINHWALRLGLDQEVALLHPSLGELVVDLEDLHIAKVTNFGRIEYNVSAVSHEGRLAFKIGLEYKGPPMGIEIEIPYAPNLGITIYELAATVFVVARPEEGRWEPIIKPHARVEGLWGLAQIAAEGGLGYLTYKVSQQSFWTKGYIRELVTWLLGGTDARVRGAVDDEVKLLYSTTPSYLELSVSPPVSAPMVISPANVEILRSKIDHIVVLMLENRSFDHMLGYLSLPPWNRSDVHGLRPDYSVPVGLGSTQRQTVFPLTINSPAVAGPSPFPPSVTRFLYDPGHDFGSTYYQRGGYRAATLPNFQGSTNVGLGIRIPTPTPGQLIEVKPTEGFVIEFEMRLRGSYGTRLSEELIQRLKTQVMGYYTAQQVPVYHFLSEQFRICDHWHAAVPGHTWPNRFTTITGMLTPDSEGRPSPNNPDMIAFDPLERLTIFDHLSMRGVSWRYYEHDFCFLRLFKKYTFDQSNILPFEERFFNDAARGDLPSVTFIEPDLSDVPNELRPANDDHPPADIGHGQRLVQRIYEALRRSPKWERTLFIITYDEHGGFYDHVFPEEIPTLAPLFTWPLSTSVPPWWPHTRAQYMVPLSPTDEVPVKFRGMRVPTFLVSPHVAPRSVSHTVYDHTSIIKTIITRFLADRPPDMGPRVAQALDLAPELAPRPSISPEVVVKGALQNAPASPSFNPQDIQRRGIEQFPQADDHSQDSHAMLRQFRERYREVPK